MGTPAEFRRVMRLGFEGSLQPMIHQVMPLEDAGLAHRILEDGKVFGKVVLEP